MCYGVVYIIEVSFKNNKYKFNPIDVSYSADNQVFFGIDRNSEFYDKNGKIRKIYKSYPNDIELIFNDLNESLKNYLLNASKEDDW